MEKLPHYHFSWIVSFQKQRYHVCEMLGDRRGLLSFEGGSSRSHWVEESFWKRLWTCLVNRRKFQVLSRTCHEDLDEDSYSSTLSLTSALDVGGWLRPCPVCLIPRETDPFYKRLSGTQGRCERVRKNVAPTRIFFLSLCTLSVLLLPDCPVFCVLSLLHSTYNINIHAPSGFEPAIPASDWLHTHTP
jgi:hypothetical protein